MKRFRQILAAMFLLAVVLFFAQNLNAWLVANKWEALKSSDWAAWIQAIGSILAILYAVKIANSDREFQKSEKIIFAVLQGQSIKYQLDEFIYMARHHSENLTVDQVRSERANALLSWFDKQPMWTIEEISLLAALPGGVAIDFAKGQAAIRAGIVEMKYARDTDPPRSDGESRNDGLMKRSKKGLELYWEGVNLLQTVRSKLPERLPELRSFN